MLGRIVNNVRRKLSNPLKAEKHKNLWQNLIQIHNERKVSLLSEFERINYQKVIDVQELNRFVLKVNHISQCTSIEDIANSFPNAVMIVVEKYRTNKFKSAFIGFESESQCIDAFMDSKEMQIKGIKVIVIFAEIIFEMKTIPKSVKKVSEKCEKRVLSKPN
jgi:hypothetical protein